MISPFEQEFNQGTKKRCRRLRGRLFARDVVMQLAQVNSIEFRLAYIETVRGRKKGKGTYAMQWLCEIADVHRVRLALAPCSFAASNVGMSNVQLTAWYQKFGFRRIGMLDEMVRFPNT